ncbi:MAG: hypothetical protein DRG76_07085 [Deltaproteobacteria bacterium]|nr:MAG: hypothetical protein DRG76_07085 [Deltaproteobacteria bacterium]
MAQKGKRRKVKGSQLTMIQCTAEENPCDSLIKETRGGDFLSITSENPAFHHSSSPNEHQEGWPNQSSCKE